MSTTKQKMEINFTDVDDIHFNAPLRVHLIKSGDDNYIIVNDDLGIRARGKTPKEAAELLKDIFISTANDIVYKSKYAALNEKERKRLNIIRSVCSIGVVIDN